MLWLRSLWLLMYATPLNTSSPGGMRVVEKAFEMAVKDFLNSFPYILGGLAILLIYTAIALIVTFTLRKLLRIIHLDDVLRPLLGEAYFSLTNLIIALVDIGIALLAIYSIVVVFTPSQLGSVTLFVEYGARVASVVFLIVFLFIMFNAIIHRIRMEMKLRGFIFIISFFTATILLLDVTALSKDVKDALAWGFSIGIGLSIGVFAVWFFFHDIWEKKSSQG